MLPSLSGQVSGAQWKRNQRFVMRRTAMADKGVVTVTAMGKYERLVRAYGGVSRRRNRFVDVPIGLAAKSGVLKLARETGDVMPGRSRSRGLECLSQGPVSRQTELRGMAVSFKRVYRLSRIGYYDM
jgi:hypothetical protein